MPIHVVKQGDSMTSISDHYGFFWETIWFHENNAELRKKRPNPNILMARDRVFIPEKRSKEESGETGRVHTFRLKTVPARLNLRLLDETLQPRAGLQYTLDVDGKKTPGVVPDDGVISAVIPPGARKARLTLPDTGEEWELDIGYVNPLDYTSGVQQRLANLGYYEGPPSGAVDEKTRQALRGFQTARGLPATGEADEATLSALEDVHSS